MPTHPDPDPDLQPAGPRRGRGLQPAGRILSTIVISLCLAAVVNADALVKRAEAKPLGAGRDRSLALWHPVQDLAHITQLYRLRDLGDRLVGNEDRGGAGVPVAGSPTDAADGPRPVVRAPAAGAPLRVYIGGDSILRDAGDAFLRIAGDSPLFETTLHYENATGLARPDFFDWPAALTADMAERRPEVAFILFGGNDAQGIIDPADRTYPGLGDPGWRAEYARRVGGVMDALRADDRVVFWIGLPPMRDSGFDSRAQVMNTIYRSEAERRPWMTYVDTRPIFGDANGRYVDRKQDASGKAVVLRRDDGVHLSVPGADRLAEVLLDLIDGELNPPSATSTAATGG